MSEATMDATSRCQALVRLQTVLQMTRTFQAFITKTREIDRDDPDFQFAAESCHDALTRNLCALRDEVRAAVKRLSGSDMLERGPVKKIFDEIESVAGRADRESREARNGCNVTLP